MGQRTKIGFTAGAFDLMHAGHVLMFKDCKKVCDYLIVALQEDPSVDREWKNKPIMSLEERKILLESLKYIDEIVVYKTEKDLFKILSKMKFDVRIIGSDWEGKKYTGYFLKHHEHYFHRRTHGYSSSELRERVYTKEHERRNTNK